MPEYTPSVEAEWLVENYASLGDYRGQDLRGRWVAVLGRQIIDSDESPEELVRRVETSPHGETPLITAVVADRLG